MEKMSDFDVIVNMNIPSSGNPLQLCLSMAMEFFKNVTITESSHRMLMPQFSLILPCFWTVAAGPGRGWIGVAGPGAVGAQVLHVPREQREECGLRVSRRLSALALQQSHQEVDVAHGQPQDLVLAELFLRRVRGNEFPQLCEGCVDIMLAPALTCVGEHLPGHDTAVLLQKK